MGEWLDKKRVKCKQIYKKMKVRSSHAVDDEDLFFSASTLMI
jgi:hypothetical protein